MKIKIRSSKKETLEVNAKVLQSNVPIKYRASDHATALKTNKLISPRISSRRVVFFIFMNADVTTKSVRLEIFFREILSIDTASVTLELRDKVSLEV